MEQERVIVDGIDVTGVWSDFLEPRWVEPGNRILETIRQLPGGEEIDKCFQCGTCTAQCGVVKVTDKFNPRSLVNLVRGSYTGDLIQAYLCTLCGRCTKLCPRELDRRKLGIAIREYIVSKNEHPNNFNQMRDAMHKEHNVASYPNQERAMWAEFLDEAPSDLYQRERAEVIYFVGCMASFSPAIQDIPGKFANLLEGAGVNFSILGEREWCCGYPLIVAGMREEAEELIDYNVEQIKAMDAKTVVFTCPSCYHTFCNEYKIEDVEFLHHTEYLKRLIDEGRLRLKGLKRRVTYHDPCDLGRNSEVYEPPRETLRSIPGVEFVEMPYRRELAPCCGGGGDLEIVDAELPSQIGQRLTTQAERIGAEMLITACGQCRRVLGGVKEKRVEIKDILELVVEAT